MDEELTLISVRVPRSSMVRARRLAKLIGQRPTQLVRNAFLVGLSTMEADAGRVELDRKERAR